MARRSPTNARYQKYQEPAGKTRKSAAAAKPSRKATASTSGSSSAKGSRANLDPQTPEFKALRKTWGKLLTAAIIFIMISLGLRLVDRPGGLLSGQVAVGSSHLSYAMLLSTAVLVAGYACLLYAIYLDFSKVRPMRLAYAQAEKLAEKPAKPSKKDSSKA